MGEFVDLTGQKFGKLTVTSRAQNKGNMSRWVCRCECGEVRIVYGNNLRRGHTTSCGCIKGELPNHRTHGKSYTSAYRTWAHMKGRCYTKSDKCYEDYGARGITVCDRWRENFEAFYEDVSKLPRFGEKGCTLDRIDTNGNYELNNVRWASSQIQNNNKRNNRLITYADKTQTLSQWADELDISYKLLWHRLYKLGWSVQKAFSTETQAKYRPKRIGGRICHTR